MDNEDLLATQILEEVAEHRRSLREIGEPQSFVSHLVRDQLEARIADLLGCSSCADFRTHMMPMCVQQPAPVVRGRPGGPKGVTLAINGLPRMGFAVLTEDDAAPTYAQVVGAGRDWLPGPRAHHLGQATEPRSMTTGPERNPR